MGERGRERERRGGEREGRGKEEAREREERGKGEGGERDRGGSREQGAGRNEGEKRRGSGKEERRGRRKINDTTNVTSVVGISMYVRMLLFTKLSWRCRVTVKDSYKKPRGWVGGGGKERERGREIGREGGREEGREEGGEGGRTYVLVRIFNDGGREWSG